MRDDGIQKRSGGGVERRRTVPLWGPLTIIVVIAVGSLLVMQVQTLPDPLPESAFAGLPDRGIGIDPDLAHAGEELYRINCSACHRAENSAAVGPTLQGVTGRRPYPWIRGMVQEPDSMHREDPVARRLLLQWRVPMRDVGLSEPQFRAVLEYLRLQDRPVGSAEVPRRFGPAPTRADSALTAAAPAMDSALVRPAVVRASGAPAPRALIDSVGGSRPDPEGGDTVRAPGPTTVSGDTLRAPGPTTGSGDTVRTPGGG